MNRNAAHGHRIFLVAISRGQRDVEKWRRNLGIRIETSHRNRPSGRKTIASGCWALTDKNCRIIGVSRAARVIPASPRRRIHPRRPNRIEHQCVFPRRIPHAPVRQQDPTQRGSRFEVVGVHTEQATQLRNTLASMSPRAESSVASARRAFPSPGCSSRRLRTNTSKSRIRSRAPHRWLRALHRRAVHSPDRVAALPTRRPAQPSLSALRLQISQQHPSQPRNACCNASAFFDRSAGFAVMPLCVLGLRHLDVSSAPLLHLVRHPPSRVSRRECSIACSYTDPSGCTAEPAPEVISDRACHARITSS